MNCYLRVALIATLVSAAMVAPEAYSSTGDAQLTPELIRKTVTCESTARLGPFFPLTLGQATPTWMTKNAKDSTLGLNVYDLQQPIDVLGQPRNQFAMHQQWASVVLPASADLPAMAASLKLKRAPYGSARQYYRFLGKEGPMLSVYELLENPFEAIGKTDLSQLKKKVMLGCNYTPITEQQFLDAAREADALVKEMASQMRGGTEQAAGTGGKK